MKKRREIGEIGGGCESMVGLICEKREEIGVESPFF